MSKPTSAGSRKKDEWQQAIKDDDDQHQAECGLEHFVYAPGTIAKYGEAHRHRNGGSDQLRQNCHGERRPAARYSQTGLDNLLEGVNVVLEITRQKFADLLVKPIDVRDERQQGKEER